MYDKPCVKYINIILEGGKTNLIREKKHKLVRKMLMIFKIWSSKDNKLKNKNQIVTTDFRYFYVTIRTQIVVFVSINIIRWIVQNWF